MEEEEKQIPEEHSEQVLSKEEILERSRKENSHGDERATNAIMKASYIAMATGGVLCICLYLLFLFVLHEMRYELFFVYAAMMAVSTWVQFFHIRKKAQLIGAIAFTVAAVGFVIILILQLAGVA